MTLALRNPACHAAAPVTDPGVPAGTMAAEDGLAGLYSAGL